MIRIRRAKLEHGAAVPRGAEVRFDAAAAWLTVVHQGVLCVFNFATHRQRVPVPDGAWELMLASDQEAEPGRTDAVAAGATGIFADARLAEKLRRV